jgi:uncharacterized protein YajQ (UPF0234 family)
VNLVVFQMAISSGPQDEENGLKVQASIQGEELRVTGKKIDDLQEVIALLKASDVGVPLQFVNMKS